MKRCCYIVDNITEKSIIEKEIYSIFTVLNKFLKINSICCIYSNKEVVYATGNRYHYFQKELKNGNIKGGF